MTIETLSLKIFGTEDYASMLDVLSPSSHLVRTFKEEVKKLNSMKGNSNE